MPHVPGPLIRIGSAIGSPAPPCAGHALSLRPPRLAMGKQVQPATGKGGNAEQ
jgi:hypothetical protein